MTVADEPATGPSWAEFAECLEVDFNTPEALAILHRWHAAGDAALLARGLGVFGLPKPTRVHRVHVSFGMTLGDSVSGEIGRRVPEDVVGLFERRLEARRTRDYATSDELRARISAAGFEVEDTPDGSRLVIRESE